MKRSAPLGTPWKDRLAGEHVRNLWSDRYESYFIAGGVVGGGISSWGQPVSQRLYIYPHIPGTDVVVDRVGIRIGNTNASGKYVTIGFYSLTSFRQTADFYPERLVGQVRIALGMGAATGRLFWIDCWFPLFSFYPYWVAVAMSDGVAWPSSVGLVSASILTTSYGTSGNDGDNIPTIALYKNGHTDTYLPPTLDSGLLRLAPTSAVPAVYLRYALGINPWGQTGAPGGGGEGGTGGTGIGGGE